MLRRSWRARFWGAIPLGVAAVLLIVRAWLHVEPLDRLAVVGPELGDPPGTTARAGSIYIARGGPVILGYQSDGEARLRFAGAEMHGHGFVRSLVVVPHGAVPLR